MPVPGSIGRWGNPNYGGYGDATQRYSNAVYEDPDFYNKALFGQGEDVNNMVSLFASIFGSPKNRMAGINKYYDTAAGNLGQRGDTIRGQAMSEAGAQAGARGLLNPSAFINQAGSQAYNPFIQALGGLEEQRAGALNSYDQQMRQMLMQLVTGAKQQSMQRDYENEQNSPGALDWITGIAPLLAAPFTGGTSLLGYALQPSMWGGGKK